MLSINLGGDPGILANTIGPQISDLRYKHKEKYYEFEKYINTDKALKSQLISAVNEAYIRSKRKKNM